MEHRAAVVWSAPRREGTQKDSDTDLRPLLHLRTAGPGLGMQQIVLLQFRAHQVGERGGYCFRR